MKVTYQTCCGVDVHKSFLVATIVKTTGGIANPKWVKAVKGNKDDTKDSKWIGGFIPSRTCQRQLYPL